MFADEFFCPDSIIPFPTYRPPRDDGNGFLWKPAEISATVAHYYFSERFRETDNETRRSVLDLPSASEARKFAQRTPAPEKWMNDRLDIVKAALWSQFKTLPLLAERLVNGSLAIGSGKALGHGWESRRRGDERWKLAVLKSAQQFVAAERMTLLATGDTDILNPFLFASRLAALLDGKRPTDVLVACRGGVDAMAENWAIQHHIPVIHHPLRTVPGASTSESAIQSLAEVATHAIVITRGEDSTIQQLRYQLNQRQIPTRAIILDKDGRPVPTKTKSSRPRR